MKNKSILYIAFFVIFLLILLIPLNYVRISQELNIKNEYIELNNIEINWQKNIISKLKIENARLKDINYEKAVTFGMLICAGDGDKGELHPTAPIRDKKGIEQVIENRMFFTGRTFYQEATAAYQFSAFNYDKKRKTDGLIINKYNIPRQSKCLEEAIDVMTKEDFKEFKDSTFYHAYGSMPEWKNYFRETTRTNLHIFYNGDKGYVEAKIIKPIKKKKIKKEKVLRNKIYKSTIQDTIKNIDEMIKQIKT